MTFLRSLSVFFLNVLTMGPAMVDKCMDRPGIVYRIGRMEGIYAEKGIPRSHNNPGSLVFVGQPGATRGVRGFARFSTLQEGWEALDRDLRAKKFDKKRMKRAWSWMK